MGDPRLHLVYLAPADIQVARVDRQAIVYFCSALARLGVRVELVALGIRLARSEKHRPEDPLSLYRLRASFPVEIVPTHLHQDSSPWIVGLTRLRIHAAASWKRAGRHDDELPLVFYTKNYAPALALLLMRRLRRSFCIAFEAHVPPRNHFQRFLLRRVDAVIANSHALAKDLRAARQVANKRILGIHQGVDLEPFEKPVDKTELRATLSLPGDRSLAVYTGKIFRGYQEVEYILDAARADALRDVLFVLVGGREDHVESLRASAQSAGLHNIVFTGFVPPRTAHLYQRAADVLILYYPSGLELNRYRSPGKLFEYMASAVPIVAGDLPVLREILGDPPAAVLVPPDSPGLLAAAIADLLTNPERAKALSAEAHRRSREFTWDKRARHVSEFLLDCAGG